MTKKLLYLCVTALMGLLTSCSQDVTPDEPQLPASDRVTLTASLPEDFALPGAKSRALPSMEGYQLRCILEVWTKDETPVLKQRIEQAGLTGDKVVFDFKIEQGNYDCLFWADVIDAGATQSEMKMGGLTVTHYPDKFYYTFYGLKSISYSQEGISTFNTDAKDAFFGNYELMKGVAAVENQTIPALTRPFAKMTVKEKNSDLYIYCSDLTAKYMRSEGFNVLTGKASDTGQMVTYTGKSGERNTLFYDYIFTDATSILGEINLTFAGVEGKKLYPVTIPAGIPLKRNHKTNVLGSLIAENTETEDVQLVVTIDTEWDTPNEDYEILPPAKVGDYYYDDNTWSTALYAGKTCIGIVYEVNADGKSGKIVSLDEGKGLTWATEGTTYAKAATHATNLADGMVNMVTIKALDDDFSDFPAFQWCADKTKGGLTWYLPAPYELQDLYAATCGLKIVETNPQDGEIKRWNISGEGNYMPGDSGYESQRITFENRIIAAGGPKLGSCVSSYEDGDEYAVDISCSISGTGMINSKILERTVRAIAKFPKQ